MAGLSRVRISSETRGFIVHTGLGLTKPGVGVKLPGPEVDLGPPFSTKAKSGCSCMSASHAFVHGIDRDSVTFTLVNAQKDVDNCHVSRPGEGQT